MLRWISAHRAGVAGVVERGLRERGEEPAGVQRALLPGRGEGEAGDQECDGCTVSGAGRCRGVEWGVQDLREDPGRA